MNVPAIARQTFESLRNQPIFLAISNFVIEHLNKIKNSHERARFIHNVVDEYNKEVFAHPILKELVPCKSGCTGCCHTQVSVTEDEANLLVAHIEAGVEIDYSLLAQQASVGNDAGDFFKIPYRNRACIFLDEKGSCKVYADRPSVCRTNAVVGDAAQCDTTNGQVGSLRLVKTQKADMAIVGAYFQAKSSGTLPLMVSKILKAKYGEKNQIKSKGRKAVFKDHDL